MVKRKPKKHKKRGRPPNKKLSAYMKGKRGLERYEREHRERIQKEQEAFDERMRHSQQEAAKLRTSKWTTDLSWESNPPPPEVIYMIIGGKPVRCRLTHMHNMPVYLPDIEELP